MLASPGLSTNILYWQLKEEYPQLRLILEQKVSPLKLVVGRIRKVGVVNVLGQLAFLGLVLPFLKHNSRQRKDGLIKEFRLCVRSVEERVIGVPLVNAEITRQQLRALLKCPPKTGPGVK